ncbi:hypothetical protein EBQ93_00595 [bacterium]|nr:hypothetical protein [bacterium]
MKKLVLLVTICIHTLNFSADGAAAGGGGRARTQSEEAIIRDLQSGTAGGAEWIRHGMSVTFDGENYWDDHDGPYSENEILAKVKDHTLFQEQAVAHERGDLSRYRSLQLQRAELADRANDFMPAADLYREAGRLDKVSALAHRAEAMKKYDDAFLIFESLEDAASLTRVGRIIARQYRAQRKFIRAYNLYVRIGYLPGIYTVFVDTIEEAMREENMQFVISLADFVMQPGAAYDWYVYHNDRKRLERLRDVLEDLVKDYPKYDEYAEKICRFLEDDDAISVYFGHE